MKRLVLVVMLLGVLGAEEVKSSHKEAAFPDKDRLELFILKSKILDMKLQIDGLNGQLASLAREYDEKVKVLTPPGFHMDNTLMQLVPNKEKK